MADVSVVIPCYNAAKFLGEALSSVFAQTIRPAEIIVVDDGSTDETAQIARDQGVRVIRFEQNVGTAAARNIGLHAAQGDLVAWFDGDDIWEPEHLATVIPLLERFPAAVLAFSLVRMFGSQSGVWPALLPSDVLVNAEYACLRRCILPQNTVVVRRAEVLSAGGYDERLRVAEDYDLWLRLSHQYPFVCTHAVTCNWRRHDAQTSGNIEQYWAGEYESRRRYRALISAEESLDAVLHLDERMREVWREHLDTAWHTRNVRHFDYHLAMAAVVPGAETFVSTYRFRRSLLPAARIWDARPEWVKAGIRGLRTPILLGAADRP